MSSADPPFPPTDAAQAPTLAELQARLSACEADKAALAAELERRENHQVQFARVHRALRTLSGGDRALVAATDEVTLAHDICRTIVEEGGYRLAWIGLARDDEDRTVEPLAQFGFEEGYLERAGITWADTDRGRGPTGTAIRERRACVVRDIRTDPAMAPWRGEALQRGYASSVALPVLNDRQLLGALMVYAPEPDAFDDEEVRLLQALANDTAYGLLALRTREVQREQEAELLRRSLELQHARELASLMLDFLSAVSHDMRTPITSIKGYTEFLEEGVGGGISPQQHDFVAQIAKSAGRLEGLVDDLLDMARLDAGAFELRAAPIDLAEKMHEAVASLFPQAQEAGVTLATEPEPGALPVVADPQRIERVLVNLIQNAIKFTPPGGRIALAGHVEGDRVVCGVTDTGVGIAPEDQPKLFQRFSQLAAGRRRGGTGLGLGICRALVEAHGGTIGVRSEPGRGSTFWFALPKTPRSGQP